MDNLIEMKLDKIKILPFFEARPPHVEKIERKRAYYIRNLAYDGHIAVDRSGWLVDGYVTYLLMRESGEEKAMVRVAKDPCAVVLAGEYGEEWEAYAVPMVLARLVRPGMRLLLRANGRFRRVTARALEIDSYRPAWPAWGMVLPGRQA